jgi:hypothetical protein
LAQKSLRGQKTWLGILEINYKIWENSYIS